MYKIERKTEPNLFLPNFHKPTQIQAWTMKNQFLNLNVHYRIENRPIYSDSYKNNTLKISHS